MTTTEFILCTAPLRRAGSVQFLRRMRCARPAPDPGAAPARQESSVPARNPVLGERLGGVDPPRSGTAPDAGAGRLGARRPADNVGCTAPGVVAFAAAVRGLGLVTGSYWDVCAGHWPGGRHVG